MNKIASLLRVGAFCVLTGFATAGAATVVTFDDVSSGTTLSNQYLGLGVIFEGDFTVSDNTFGGLLTAPTLPNYIALAGTVSTLGFVVPGNPGRTATTDSLSVTVPGLAENGGCYGPFVMDAYDRNNNLIGTLSVPGIGSEGGPQKTYTLSAPGIAFVNFTNGQNSCVVPFDNLTFELLGLGVPTLDPAAVALLALLLALASVVALRRRA